MYRTCHALHFALCVFFSLSLAQFGYILFTNTALVKDILSAQLSAHPPHPVSVYSLLLLLFIQVNDFIQLSDFVRTQGQGLSWAQRKRKDAKKKDKEKGSREKIH